MIKDALDDYPSKQEILKTIFDAVYAQYPKKEWQGLTDDEIREMGFKDSESFDSARAIEAKLKENNHG